MRGGEKVLEALVELYPDATLYTLFHEPGKVSPALESRPIVTSWLNRIPGIYSHYRRFLPLFPSAMESLRIEAADIVISSSHAVAQGARTRQAMHICYCHTPMRYIWDSFGDYRFGLVDRAALSIVRPRFQNWDRRAAQRVQHFVANSSFVASRIRTIYGREATVIHPPVDTEFFTPPPTNTREDFYLYVGALVPYKRVDLIISAFNRMGRRLVIAGGGSERKRLRAGAASNIEFAGWVSNEDLRRLYRSTRALVFAAREDFGIVPVEARACGCPVIAFGAGGILDTVVDGVHGTLFAEQSVESLVETVGRFEASPWNPEVLRAGVEEFSRERFKKQIQEFIDRKVGEQARARSNSASGSVGR